MKYKKSFNCLTLNIDTEISVREKIVIQTSTFVDNLVIKSNHRIEKISILMLDEKLIKEYKVNDEAFIINLTSLLIDMCLIKIFFCDHSITHNVLLI